MYSVYMITDEDGEPVWVVSNEVDIAAWDFLCAADAEEYAADLNAEMV